MAVHAGANQYTGPAYSAKAVVGNITTRYSQQRQAGWVKKQSVYMRCLCLHRSQYLGSKLLAVTLFLHLS